MKYSTRLAFLAMLIAGTFFVAQRPIEAANFCDTSAGYQIRFIGSMNCYPNWPIFCSEMDLECMVDCPGDWYGICFDGSNPCEYYCCCKIDG